VANFTRAGLGIAIQMEKLTVALFRSIEIGDVYGNIKVGEYEVTFHKLKESSRDADNDLVMPIETSLRHSHYQLDRKDGGARPPRNWRLRRRV
jgi:hypothetical protein